MHSEGETGMAEATEKAKKAKAPAKPRATGVAKENHGEEADGSGKGTGNYTDT